jgi:hypothetical protein
MAQSSYIEALTRRNPSNSKKIKQHEKEMNQKPSQRKFELAPLEREKRLREQMRVEKRTVS